MKHLILSLVTVFLLASAQASQAQTATSVSGSTSNSRSGAASQSGAQANNLIIFPSTPSSTKAEIESAPPVSAPSVFGGGHPCLAGRSGGVSIVGGGVSYGQGDAEPACMAWMMGNPELAMAIMMENEKFRRAVCRVGFYRIGTTTYPVQCATTLPASATKTASKTPLEVDCRRSNGKITPVVSRAVMNGNVNAYPAGPSKPQRLYRRRPRTKMALET